MNFTIFLSSFKEELLASAALAVVLFLLANAATWLVSSKQSIETQRFWRLTFRHVAAMAFVLCLTFIWRKELQTVMIALGAATAALIVTFRENILSMSAFWLRIGRRHYGLDDFIEVDGIRGRVLDITWLSTVLAETGPGKDGLTYSGRVVHVPNSRIMLSPLFVENLTGEFSAHLINVPLPENADAIKAEQLLIEVANNICAPYLADAEQHMRGLQRAQALDTPSVEPKTNIKIAEEGLVTLVLRVVVPFSEKQRLEQAVLRDFLSRADATVWPRAGGSV